MSVLRENTCRAEAAETREPCSNWPGRTPRSGRRAEAMTAGLALRGGV